MKIYLLERIGHTGYDEFYGCVVAAKTADAAVNIAPNGKAFNGKNNEWVGDISEIKCTEIGNANKAQKEGVIMASFNAA
jgi:hypothetical protein